MIDILRDPTQVLGRKVGSTVLGTGSLPTVTITPKIGIEDEGPKDLEFTPIDGRRCIDRRRSRYRLGLIKREDMFILRQWAGSVTISNGGIAERCHWPVTPGP